MLCPLTRPHDAPCVGSACAAWVPTSRSGLGAGQQIGSCDMVREGPRAFTDPARCRPVTTACALDLLAKGARIEASDNPEPLKTPLAIEAATAPLVHVR